MAEIDTEQVMIAFEPEADNLSQSGFAQKADNRIDHRLKDTNWAVNFTKLSIRTTFSWIFMDFYGFSWIIMDFHG